MGGRTKPPNTQTVKSPSPGAPQRRIRDPRENGAIAVSLGYSITNHKIVRIAMVAILSVINCVLTSYLAGGGGKDTGMQCLWVEAIYSIILVAFLAVDDIYWYTPRIDTLVNYWKRIATRDSLTGLHNRLAFLQALDQRIAIAEATRARYGVMFIDLNKFKEINDTFGHAVGDGVLTISARRIMSVVGKDDLVARLGGDEFAILLMRTNVVLARRIEVEIENSFKAPMLINGQALYVGASLGTCLASDHHTHAEDVIHSADILMYRQKALTRWGGNTRVNQAKIQGIKRSR